MRRLWRGRKARLLRLCGQKNSVSGLSLVKSPAPIAGSAPHSPQVCATALMAAACWGMLAVTQLRYSPNVSAPLT